jgi:hypothetical protein
LREQDKHREKSIVLIILFVNNIYIYKSKKEPEIVDAVGDEAHREKKGENFLVS